MATVNQINARIAKLTAALEEAQVALVAAQERAAAAVPTPKALTLPEVGTSVTFTYGRANPMQLVGTVVGTAPSGGRGQPPQVKVQVGAGFDALFYTIHPNAIAAPDADEAVAQGAQDDQEYGTRA